MSKSKIEIDDQFEYPDHKKFVKDLGKDLTLIIVTAFISGALICGGLIWAILTFRDWLRAQP